MSKKTVFTRVKSKVADEATALQQICAKDNLRPEQLQADHIEKVYRWNLIDDTATEAKEWEVYAKEDFENEAAAIAQAMQDLQAFENNLKTDHNDTEYRFAKIKG